MSGLHQVGAVTACSTGQSALGRTMSPYQPKGSKHRWYPILRELTRQLRQGQAAAWLCQVLKVVGHADLLTLPAVNGLLVAAVELGTVSALFCQAHNSEPGQGDSKQCTGLGLVPLNSGGQLAAGSLCLIIFAHNVLPAQGMTCLHSACHSGYWVVTPGLLTCGSHCLEGPCTQPAMQHSSRYSSSVQLKRHPCSQWSSSGNLALVACARQHPLAPILHSVS
jgi:hypothetical protein